MKSYFIVRWNCYMLNKESNSLEFFEPIRFTLYTDCSSVKYVAKIGGKEQEILVEDHQGLFYHSEEDFAKGECLNERLGQYKEEWFYNNAFLTNFHCGDNNQYWIWKDGSPVQTKLEHLVFTGNFVNEHGYIYVRNVRCSNFTNPVYQSREEAFESNYYKVVEADGTERKVIGRGLRMKLSAEQRVALQNFVDAAKKLKEAKVGLFTDISESCATFAVNVSDVDKAYSYECDDEDQDNVLCADNYLKEVVDLDLFDYSESLFLKFKR